MQLAAVDLRKGYLVRYQGAIAIVSHWNILRNDRRMFVQLRLRDFRTGRVTELKEHGDTKYEVLESAIVDLMHSYRDGAEEVFYSSTVASEEYRCPADAAADALRWSCETYKGMVLEGSLAFVSPPATVVATVVETAAPIKGDTLMKEARLDNGVVVQVSAIVKTGDRVRIESETLEFKDRVTT